MVWLISRRSREAADSPRLQIRARRLETFPLRRPIRAPRRVSRTSRRLRIRPSLTSNKRQVPDRAVEVSDRRELIWGAGALALAEAPVLSCNADARRRTS